MNTEQLLSVCAIIRAYADRDGESFEILVRDAPETGYGDLLAFIVMVLEFHHGDAVKYVSDMADGIVRLHIDEVARSN